MNHVQQTPGWLRADPPSHTIDTSEPRGEASRRSWRWRRLDPGGYPLYGEYQILELVYQSSPRTQRLMFQEQLYPGVPLLERLIKIYYYPSSPPQSL